MKLTRTSSELNEITEATKDQLEELQSDLTSKLSFEFVTYCITCVSCT